jgi:tocopherol cyclase
MPTYLQRIRHPEWYHGYQKAPPFFEGWYYKLIDPTEQHRYAVIPGIFLSHDPAKQHAFIQVLDGQTGKAAYFQFPASEFVAAQDDFDVRIGPNHFRADRIHLALEGESLALKGELRFSGLTPWPVTWLAPGIMGPFGWLEFMECYHGVLSLDHSIHGSLTLEGRTLDFSGGSGYIEKDWGQSFPAGWVWMQTNHFDTPQVCLTASIAVIPFRVFSFAGFIVGFWHEEQLYRFTTYTGARVRKLGISDQMVDWVLENDLYTLEIRAQRARGGLLLEPNRVEMHRRVEETLNAAVDVQLTRRQDQRVLFHETGRNAGLEVQGTDRLQGLLR